MKVGLVYGMVGMRLRERTIEKDRLMGKRYAHEIQALEQLYSFRGKTEVIRFLEMHSFLVPLLLEAYGRIKSHFSDAQFFLKVVADPEATDDDPDNNTEMMDDYEELIAFIATHLAPQEAIEILKQFYQEWWLNAANLSKGKLGINLECL